MAPLIADGDGSGVELLVVLAWVVIGIVSWIVNRARRAAAESRAESERVRSGDEEPRTSNVPPSLQALLKALEAQADRGGAEEDAEEASRPSRYEPEYQAEPEVEPVEEVGTRGYPAADATVTAASGAGADAYSRRVPTSRLEEAEARVLEAERAADEARTAVALAGAEAGAPPDVGADVSIEPAASALEPPGGEGGPAPAVVAGVGYPALLRRGASRGEVRAAVAWACALGPPRGTVPHGGGDFLGPPGGAAPFGN